MNNLIISSTPNKAASREGHSVSLIVIHSAEGSREAVESWFGDAASKVSAHYLVCRDGTVIQFVNQLQVAWHAGEVVSPTAKQISNHPSVNPNLYSVGIEHEGTKADDLTPAQRASTIELIREISTAWGFPIDRDHVVGHREIKSSKTCPNQINVDRLVEQAASVAHPKSPDTLPPRIVWSTLFGQYLIVIQIVDDTKWFFIKTEDLPHSGDFAIDVQIHEGRTSLSGMPQ